ncbi:hypothetical protein V7S43_017728 [Phytophthora oleae]|uniref:RxLR effector protein n=1 Tax=Phytophthora oleae TaxID=2107226 RepID=A0ABD3EWP4_9STRA
MGLTGIALLVLFSLVMNINAASLHKNNMKQFAASNTKSMHVLPFPRDTSGVSRYLRTGPTPDSEERAIPNEILNAVDHAGKVFMTGIYSHDSSFLNWLDRFFLRLEYKYWLLKRKTPEDAAKILGLHHVLNIESHPNYQKWLGYLEAYDKKFHKN